jgi:hypothetical protein
MPTITVRKLDATYDPIFGNGQNAYISDLGAVAQIINQRLLLFQTEWWEDRSIGIPMFQSILGPDRNVDAVTALIKSTILASPYVTGVSNVATSYSSKTRSFVYSCQVQTQFGSLTVSNQGF